MFCLKMRHIILSLIIVLGVASLTYGQMYKWVDEKGCIHFTDDLSKVPEKYRREAESREVQEETPPPLPEDQPMPPAESTVPEEPKGSEVNLIRKYGVWLAEVVLNERVRRHFVVDTGASFTLISWQTAEDLGIAMDENTLLMPATGVSGFILTPMVNLKSVRVGKTVSQDVETLVHDMPAGQDGLLGNSFFNEFKVVLDPSSGKMTLFSLKGSSSPDRPGGYGRDYWAGRFRFYREILAELRLRKKEYEDRRSSLQVDGINRAIRFFENQLNELERTASLAGVPRNWRE